MLTLPWHGADPWKYYSFSLNSLLLEAGILLVEISFDLNFLDQVQNDDQLFFLR